MRLKNTKYLFILAILQGFLVTGCDRSTDRQETAAGSPAGEFQCDPDNGGITLPTGFCAAIVADNLGFVRHLAVNERGDIYVALRNQSLHLGGLLALRDDDGDGRIDIIERISNEPGMGIGFHSGYLYFASDHTLYRYKFENGGLLPVGPPEKVITGFPKQVLHAGKSFAFDSNGMIYLNIGSPSNACQSEELVPDSKGLHPCPQLESHGGIWRFDGSLTGQDFMRHGDRYASGVRNAYAIDWNASTNSLYIVQHGRDQLYDLWPGIYTREMDDRLPAEEFLFIEENGEYSWPYCYYDQIANRRVVSPEYGGDGITTGDCERFPAPLIAFPGHYGPNDMIFYNAGQFPDHYANGAFIAFHNAYLDDDGTRTGYHVVFVPFTGNFPTDGWEVFADGFRGGSKTSNPTDTEHRPTGLATGADGSLYISDSVQGRIWRVMYRP